MLAALKEAITLGRYYEQVDPAQDPDAVERNAEYRRLLDELTTGDSAKAIEELVTFAAGAVLTLAASTGNDPLELLESIKAWPRD
jgi:hypothetical protein